MKCKFIILGLTAILSIYSTSCDGGNSNDQVDSSSASTAQSLSPDELRDGDNILYNSNAGSSTVLSALDLDSSGITVVNASVYTYSKVGERLFTIQRSGVSTPEQTLEDALISNLTGTDIEAPLGNQLRRLLARPEADFTAAELEQIVRILNPFGTNLAVGSDNTLLAYTGGIHTHLVTSTNESRNLGSMGGTYILQTPSFEIDFRRPNNSELIDYRFFTSDNWVPFITTNFRQDEVIEEGTWTLELSNSTF